MQITFDNPTHPLQIKNVPKVSIGIPVYNGEKYIREAIDSILSQTFSDFELIISDNASTDGTETICRKYADQDRRIRYVRQPENRGAKFNFRFVLDQGTGEFFKWMAHDDFLHPHFLEKTTEILEKYDEVVLCATDVVTLHGNEGNERIIESFIAMREHKTWEESLSIMLVCLSPYVNPTFKTNFSKLFYGLYRTQTVRAAFQDIIFLDKIITCEFPPLTRVALRGRIVALETTLWTYRHHSLSQSASDPEFISPHKRYFKYHLLWDIYKIYLIAKSRLTGRTKASLIFRVFLAHPKGLIVELRNVFRLTLRKIIIQTLGAHWLHIIRCYLLPSREKITNRNRG